MRWQQRGTRTDRGALGFREDTLNLRRPRDFDRHVWVTHIRVAASRTARVALLRRGYDTEDGLLFLAFMTDPRRQFTPLMQRLAAHDALHRHTRHVGGALFAIPPGATPESFLAQPLF